MTKRPPGGKEEILIARPCLYTRRNFLIDTVSTVAVVALAGCGNKPADPGAGNDSAGSGTGTDTGGGSGSSGGSSDDGSTGDGGNGGTGGSTDGGGSEPLPDDGAVPTSFPEPNTGLDFPGSASVSSTMRFRFLNPLSIYPATYLWRAFPRQQNGYYTAFFWGNDDGQGNLNTFIWHNGGADTYYGAHPYPDPPPHGANHNWEISVNANDYQNGAVVYNRWYTQALRVWMDASGQKHHEFYWDLPNTDDAHRVIRISPSHTNNVYPPVPALTWGDAPWAPGNEVWNGILTGIQIYAIDLSLADILSELETPLSTSEGASFVWYINTSPRPDDITDKSGQGHHPSWVGSERPALWTKP